MFLQAVTVQISLQPCVAVFHLCNRAESSRPVDDKVIAIVAPGLRSSDERAGI